MFDELSEVRVTAVPHGDTFDLEAISA